MVEQSDDHDRVDFVIHLAIDCHVRARFAVALAEVTGQLDAGRKRLGGQMLLNHLNVPIVASREAGATHADGDGMKRFRGHIAD